jgi:hypothetical protein
MAQDLFRVGLGIADDNIEYLSGAGAPLGTSGSTFNAPIGSHFTNNSNGDVYIKKTNNGTSDDWQMLASGGNLTGISTEVNAIETAAGLNADGTFKAHVGSNYIDAATTMFAVDAALDAQLYTTTTGLASEVTARTAADTSIRADFAAADTTEAGIRAAADTALQTEVDAIEAGAGLETNGTYVTPVGTNYLSTATSLKGADSLLDAAIKAAVDTQAATDAAQDVVIASKVSKAGDTMSGNLNMNSNEVIGLPSIPSGATAAVSKSYLDSVITGLTWKAPVNTIGATNPATAAIGDRFLNTTDNKIYTATAVNTWDGGVVPVDGWAVFDSSTETGYVFSGTTWVQFTGGGQIVAGMGLSKTGNQLDVNLGAGIAQLPTDEVGVDVLTTGGLFTTVDGTTSSTDTSAQLAVKLDGTSITSGVNGVKVSDTITTALSNATTGLAQEIINRTNADATITTNYQAADATITTNYQAADATLQTNINALAAEVAVTGSASAVTALTVVDGTALVDSIEVAKWIVSVVGTGANANKKLVAEVLATHDGTPTADATAADFTVYAKLKFGNITGLTFDVILSGTGVAQTMQLAVSSTMQVNVKSIRTSL